jgi:hypothetical protein
VWKRKFGLKKKKKKKNNQLSGSTLVDLLVLRAGVTLTGSFGAAVEPLAFVHGTACGAGVQATLNKVDRKSQCFSVSF